MISAIPKIFLLFIFKCKFSDFSIEKKNGLFFLDTIMIPK